MNLIILVATSYWLQHLNSLKSRSFFHLLLATRFPPTGPSASFPCRLASYDWSLAAKWARIILASANMLSVLDIGEKALLASKVGLKVLLGGPEISC